MHFRKYEREAIFFIKYFLPPIVFYFALAPQQIGTNYIVDHRCDGLLRAAPSELNKNVAALTRIPDGKSCVDSKFIDTDKDFSGNFGDLIGSLNPLLKYEVCFDQVTTLQNGDGPVDDPEEIILERYNKVPAELRIEAESGKGFEVFEGRCKEVPAWAQGHLELKPEVFSERMDIGLFERLKNEKFLVQTADDPHIYENQFFMQDTTIRVRPKHIQIYALVGIVIAWVLIVLQVISPLKQKFQSLHKQKDLRG